MNNLAALEATEELSPIFNQPVDSSGTPELAIDLIDEDPLQPRREDNPGFSKESLDELAATIIARGVKTPISVRKAPNGRYLINHGARRFRASKIAGKTTIPAFIDEDYSDTDRVVENIQRDGLTAREIADFIGRELSKGFKKVDIARCLGKSPAYITQHLTLLDLPEPIAKIFAEGRTNDVTLLNDLNTAYKKNPDEVETMLADENQEISRGSVKALREYIERETTHESDRPKDESIHVKPKKIERGGKDPDPDKLRRPMVQVEHDRRIAHILLDRRPLSHGSAWFKYEDDGHIFECGLKSVKLVALLGD